MIGVDGFLGSRASFMVDFVVVAMGLVLPIMGWSIYIVRKKQQYALHKTVQLVLAVVLLVAVVLFEIDMRIQGWTDRAAPDGDVGAAVYASIWIHLFFAITTVGLWVYVIVKALKRIPNPPGPCDYSPKHIFWARLAAIDMCLTAITGWAFYLLAFVL